MMAQNFRRSASNITICLININSFKDCSDDRTSDLTCLFNNSKAHIYIISETKLNMDTAAKFNKNYLGKLWRHSPTTDMDAGAGVSIAYDPLMGRVEVLPMPAEIQNRTIAVQFLPPNAAPFIILGVYAPASGSTAIKRNFINKVFETRTALQQLHNCNIIIGGDFNSTVGHLERSIISEPQHSSLILLPT